jgi:hypothetical protein
MSAVLTFAALRRPSAKRQSWQRRARAAAARGVPLGENRVLRRFARTRLERVRRWRSYRLLTRMTAGVRRSAPALLSFALLGLLAAGVWISIAQYDEQRRASSSSGARGTQQSQGSGVAASGRSASLTTDLKKSADRPRTARSPQAGITLTAESRSSFTQIVSATVGVVPILVPVLLAASLNIWPLLPLLALAAVVVWLHRRRRQNRLSRLEYVASPDADQEGQDESEQTLDQPEMDVSELPAGVPDGSEDGSADAGEEVPQDAVAAGDPSPVESNPSASQAVIAGPAPAALTAEGWPSGQHYVFDEAGAALRSQYRTTCEDSALAQRWQPDRAPSDETVVVGAATPRVSIIGTTIWSSDTSSEGGADAPRQVLRRPAEGRVPPRLAVAQQRRAASPRRVPRQKVPPQHERAAGSVSLDDLEAFDRRPLQAPADLTHQLEELRQQNLMLQTRLAEAADSGRRHRSRLARPFTRRHNTR